MYICTPNNEERFTKSKLVKGRTNREISSAGSEHLPYKQGVTGSNPVSPTKRKAFQETERLFCVYRWFEYNPFMSEMRDQVKNLWSRSYIFSFDGLVFLLHARRIPFFNRLITPRFHS
jgi:hypothetical protein